MKRIRVYTLSSVALLFFLVLGIILFSPGADSKVTQLSSSSPANVVNSGDSMALLPELAESMGIQDTEYHISSTDKGVFTAVTPSHETSAVFRPEGVTISQKEIGDIKMSLSGSEVVSPVKSSESKVEYRRGNITEWYVNSPLGLEQGFTLNSRPENISGKNNLELKIDLQMNENLQVKQSENRKSIQFINSETDSVLRYGKLHAFDAEGKKLGSNMRLTDNGIVLQINDSDATYPVVIDPLFESQKIVADDADNEDHFGRSVHIDGEYAVVGSPYDNVSPCDDEPQLCEKGLYNRDQGSAYVFKRFGPSDWQQVAKLTASDGAKYDKFGYDVGISGRLIIVGSPYDNVDHCDHDGPGMFSICEDSASGNKDQGSAYIFFMNNQGNWNQVFKLLASDGYSYDHFGMSVHIDGETAVVGSPDDNVEKGCDEVDLESIGIDGFVCDDGADEYYNKDQGSAYIFQDIETMFQVQAETENVLYEIQKITADDGYKYDRFGSAVSIFGTIIVVGAPDDNIEVICPTGLSCILGGGDYNKDQGSAYVFDQVPVMPVATDDYYIPWVQIQKLVAEDGYKYDHFGTSVDIYGQTIVVGSPDDNVHECEDPGDDNVNTGDLICNLDYDSYVKDQGSAYVFERDLLMSEDIYLIPWVQVQKLIAYDGYKYDHYGFSVAIYLDKILVGSPYDNVELCQADENFLCVNDFEGNKDQGSAYLYGFVPDWGYEFINKLLASDGYAYDRFGKDVDLTESFAISGAPDANLIFNDPTRVCEREVTVENEVENDTEITEEDTGENTDLGSCGPKDQGAAYIYDIKIIFDGLFPGLDNQINLASGSGATPNKKVAIIYGFKTGTFVYTGNPCTGLVFGIKPPKLLGMGNANPDGTYSFPVFVPPLDDLQAIYMQAIDVASCTISGLYYQIIEND